ncbi:hypothetical protein NAL32_00975 [Chryseobacterium sp. Ch-15]|uniref:DUF695 domain-containing protein n=2 Tax=Chryseobacterium muglaense TaxID=2893752 RepID=A0ABR8LYZ0_9FLAO|nr:hypothetical protein [Chryseobacterium muglaense]MBD3903621.1 hypothetical protein [Chryseobacterium muglaense]MCM2552955.1 hypothetical protein [Chryseobacterium muglaense]
MKNSYIIVFFCLLNSLIMNAQNLNIEFPKSFVLGKQNFLKAQEFVPVKIFNDDGYLIENNPGISKEKEFISNNIRDFNSNDVKQIYFEIYWDVNSKDGEDLNIVVMEFISEKELQENLKTVKLFSPVYLVLGKYCIAIDGNNDNLIRTIALFYQEKIGAKYYLPKY